MNFKILYIVYDYSVYSDNSAVDICTRYSDSMCCGKCSAIGNVNTNSIPFSITNKMQRYTIFFIAVSAVHVSGSFSAQHQELKLYTQHR